MRRVGAKNRTYYNDIHLYYEDVVTAPLSPLLTTTTVTPTPTLPVPDTVKTISTPPISTSLKKKIKPSLGNKTCLPIDRDEKEASYLTPTTTLIPEKLDGVLYFPISYFIWKRQLPPPTPSPISPPWCMFPKPRVKKVTSTSHLKWDRRLPNQTTFCWGGNDTTMGHSSHPVTMDHGVGVPRFQENGTWARYSHLLCPKPHYLHNHYYSNLNQSTFNLKPKVGG